MPADLVGRELELASLGDFVDAVQGRAVALVLEGEAGVGKTTLWDAARDAARRAGVLVLDAQPAESERELSFSGLRDLFEPVQTDALDALDEPQRQALAQALSMANGDPAELHVLGVAVLNALRFLVRRRPILVAIDDVQWLDGVSSSALAYATRRLESEPLGILLAQRAPLASTLVHELRRSLSNGGFRVLRVEGLEPPELHRVIRNQLGVTVPRPLLAEIHAATRGNPFYALEIQRALLRTEETRARGTPLQVPPSLDDLVRERLCTLPRESREFVLAAAAYPNPTVDVVEAASEVDRRTALTPALEAEILQIEGNRLRFTHPLLAVGAYESADPARRLEIHARLAEILEDTEARAWQLARSLEDPDAASAEEIEQAAWQARTRGAIPDAARLLDRASELTPADRPAEAARRAVDAALLHLEAGDLKLAEARARGAVGRIPPSRERARATLALAKIRSYHALDEAIELFGQVADEYRGDLDLLAQAHLGVATCEYVQVRSLQDALRHARRSFAAARGLADDALRAEIVRTQLGVEALLGRRSAVKTAELALQLQRAAERRRLLDQPRTSVAVYLIWADRHAEARELVVTMLQDVDELGDESSRPYLEFLLAALDGMRGDLEGAMIQARSGQDSAEQNDQPLFAAYNLALEGFLQAERGHEGAMESTERARHLAPDNGLVRLLTSQTMGRVHLAEGAPENAVAWLEPALEGARTEGIVEPAAIRFTTDLVDALAQLGRTGDATAVLRWYERHARRLERASALAACARSRGLMAAQSGDLDAAIAAYGEALDWHDRVEMPVERSRTLIALGSAQRRANRRREARCTLGEAVVALERAGAELWARSARAELRRISGRAPRPDRLTPAEDRIAQLVASGKTNREVASILYLSDRTVEWHLSHVFTKLGISRRAELADALSRRQTPVVAGSNPGELPDVAGLHRP